MGIVKSGRICSVEYPNGNVANLTLNEFTGNFIKVHGGGYTYNLGDPIVAVKAVEENQLFAFEVPASPDSGYKDYTWKITFSGKIGDTFLPAITLTVRKWASGQTDLSLPNVNIGSTRLIDGYNASGFFKPNSTAARPFYFGIGKGREGFDDIWIYAGLGQRDYDEGRKTEYIIPYTNAKKYFAATTIMEYNPTMGTAEDPEKYESKPNDASQATMTDTTVNITIDTLPSAVFAGGLFRIYELTNVQMTTLSNELTDPSIIESLVRTVTSPLDYVVALRAMPVTFSGFSTPLRLGNYTSQEVGSVKQINSFLFDIDCGSVSIPTFFDSFLDWSPYTNATLYLPFVGYVALNLDKFIGDSVKIKYRVDAVSGDCIAFISNNSCLIATYSGNCAYNLPLRANDSSAIVAGLYSALSGLTSGNAGQFAQGAFQLTEGVYKPNMVSTSGLSANAGSMCNRKPYLIIERPRVSVPKTYPNNIGYMCRISAKLSSIHGYTEVEAIHLDNVIATREEKAELEALLRSGVVLP